MFFIFQLLYEQGDPSNLNTSFSSFTNQTTAVTDSPALLGSVGGGGTGAGAGTSHHASNCSNQITWQSHQFQRMTFRVGTTLCAVCLRPCSDFRNPPPALECVKCHMRIHLSHVDRHEKFMACHNATKTLLLRMPTDAEKKVWISRILALRDRLRVIQQQTPDLLIDSAACAPSVSLVGSGGVLASGVGGFNSLTGGSSGGGGPLTSLTAAIKPLYRSMRAGSTGPTFRVVSSFSSASPSTSLVHRASTLNPGVTVSPLGHVSPISSVPPPAKTPSRSASVTVVTLTPTNTNTTNTVATISIFGPVDGGGTSVTSRLGLASSPTCSSPPGNQVSPNQASQAFGTPTLPSGGPINSGLTRLHSLSHGLENLKNSDV